MLDAVTVDQLRMLIAVVDQGSFTKAALHVQRAQSAVSHAIATLEFQLDVKLFDRSTRRPLLTPIGEALVPDARAVVDRANAFRARARALSGGIEPSVTLATTLLVPPVVLNGVLAEFTERFTATGLDLLVQEASGPLDVVIERQATLGIVGGFNMRGDLGEIERARIGTIPIVAVAARDHPLAAIEGAVGANDLREQRQLTSASARGAGTADPLSLNVWPIADQSVRRDLLRGGFGWGVVPAHSVTDDLAAGSLVTLHLETLGEAPSETLYAVNHRNAPLGAAGRWLIEAFARGLASEG